jgi:uncharacterized protein YegP (UPF0339 family)
MRKFPLKRPDTVVEIRRSRNGKFYYVPIAENGEPGDRSQMYASKFSAKRGANRWHPGCLIVDVVK